MNNMLEVKHLSVTFNTLTSKVHAVRDISFDIKKGSITAIVGESGCGKSVTARSIMGLVKKPGNVSDESKIIFEGNNIQEFTKKQWQSYRGRLCSICFQDALTALNPTMTIGNQIIEKICVHKKVSKSEAYPEALEMLKFVGIPNPEIRMKQYPHEFSGGMRQRVMIAIALTLNPDLIIADEPTTALDVTVQADILEMMKGIQKETNMSVILITHDLGIVANFATDIIVMYAGKIVERGTSSEIFYNPTHPYTKALLNAVPRLDMKDEKLESIEGTPPNMVNPPKGCAFYERCKVRLDQCQNIEPNVTVINETHSVNCIRCTEQAHE